MFFKDIVGHEETKRTLAASVQNGHMAHAQLFWGVAGSPNLALALAYSTYIQCEQRSETDACGVCASCSKSVKYIHPDIHFILPTAGKSETKDEAKNKARATQLQLWRGFLHELPYASASEWARYCNLDNKQLIIPAEDSRNIVYSVSLKPFEGEYKIVIIWQAELMNVTAANAMLKVLEEPPAKTIFLLVCSDIEKMLGTILSRTQLVKIRRFSDDEVVQELVEKMGVEAEKARHTAHLCEGNLFEAHNLVNDVRDDNLQKFRDWFRLCWRQDMAALVTQCDDFQAMGKEGQKGFFQFALSMLREALIWNYASISQIRLTEEEKNFMQNFGKEMNPQKIESISHVLTDAYYHLERNANAKMVYIDVSLHIARTIKG